MNKQIINLSLFYCSNSISTKEINYCAAKIENVQINAVSLPCSGKVNLLYLLKAIEKGSDGVLLLTCKIDECKYLQGSIRAQKRIETLDELLFEAGLGKGCIKCIHLKEGHKTDTLVNEINNFKMHLKTNAQLIKENV